MAYISKINVQGNVYEITANKNSEKKILATEEYADITARAAAAELVNSAPELLNTLDELAAAIGDDPNFSVTILNLLNEKSATVLKSWTVTDVG